MSGSNREVASGESMGDDRTTGVYPSSSARIEFPVVNFDRRFAVFVTIFEVVTPTGMTGSV
jgi:hypothetical protein